MVYKISDENYYCINFDYNLASNILSTEFLKAPKSTKL